MPKPLQNQIFQTIPKKKYIAELLECCGGYAQSLSRQISRDKKISNISLIDEENYYSGREFYPAMWKKKALEGINCFQVRWQLETESRVYFLVFWIVSVGINSTKTPISEKFYSIHSDLEIAEFAVDFGITLLQEINDADLRVILRIDAADHHVNLISSQYFPVHIHQEYPTILPVKTFPGTLDTTASKIISAINDK